MHRRVGSAHLGDVLLNLNMVGMNVCNGLGGGVRRLHAIGHDEPVETRGLKPLHRFT